MRKIYISGSITGRKPEDYLTQFQKKQEELEGNGYLVINPAAVNSNLPMDTTYEEYMNMSLTMLSMCDTIYMLGGWERSRGANREYGYAIAAGMEIILECEKYAK